MVFKFPNIFFSKRLILLQIRKYLLNKEASIGARFQEESTMEYGGGSYQVKVRCVKQFKKIFCNSKVLSRVKKAKKKVQEALKPGGEALTPPVLVISHSPSWS